MENRFVVFSLPRCGSTTLMHLLNCHPDIRCSDEPFCESKTDIPDFKPVENRETLDALLDGVWERYNGIKHVFVPSGWPFPMGSTLNRHLLLQAGYRVILLHRRNRLQQIVSNEMARQSHILSIDHPDIRRRIEEFPFEAIDEKAVGHMLKVWKRDVENCRTALSGRGTPFMHLAYEDMFGAAVTTKQRRKTLNKIYHFLGRDPAADGTDHTRIEALLDPVGTKVNSTDTYRLVPGIERIERLFGSRKNGWLFHSSDGWWKDLRSLWKR